MNGEKVRALNSKLLMSDTLAERSDQIEIKKYLDDLEKKREQFYHEEALVFFSIIAGTNQEKVVRRKEKEITRQEKAKRIRERNPKTTQGSEEEIHSVDERRAGRGRAHQA